MKEKQQKMTKYLMNMMLWTILKIFYENIEDTDLLQMKTVNADIEITNYRAIAKGVNIW